MDKKLSEIAGELQRDLDSKATRRVFAEGRGPDTVAQAYELQRALRQVREDRGEEVVGFKIGFTSPAVRKHATTLMGLDESVHGYLWDTESCLSGATVDHRRFGIEGELAVTLLSCDGDDVSQWEVAYEPIIEIHRMGMDGPPSDDRGRRGLELIGTNCIHAGVVHCMETKYSRLADISLDSLMTVHIAEKQTEQVTLTELEVNGVYGPVGTTTWLVQKLRAENHGEHQLIKAGAVLLCSTPGALYPVPPGAQVSVQFEGMTTTCTASI